MTLTKPSRTHTFTNGTVAQAPQVNTNFTDIFGVLEEDAYLAKGWFLVDNASFEYHASNAIKTTADVDLTSILQAGDKITWEHATTGGDRFGWVSVIDYNTTVANRTYIEIIGSAVLDEGVETDSVGISRIAQPFGFNSTANKIFLSVRLSANQTVTSGAITFNTFNTGSVSNSTFNTDTYTFTAPYDMYGTASVALRINSPADNQRYGVNYNFTSSVESNILIQAAAAGTSNQDLSSSIPFRMAKGDTLICEANFGVSDVIESSTSFTRLNIIGEALNLR